MKKLHGMKKNFFFLENKKLSKLSSILGGESSNNVTRKASCSDYNCADIDTYVDNVWIQRQTSLTDDCGTEIPKTTS